MSLKAVVIAYVVSAAAFLIADLLWLGVVARDFYLRHLGKFFADKVNWSAAWAFYVIYIAGIVVFAVRPAVRDQSLAGAVLFGSLFGFFAYATYDLTNLATLRDWPRSVVVVDIIWGTILSGITAGIGFMIAVRF